MNASGIVDQTSEKAGFNIYSALRTIQGRPNVVIHNVLKQQGLKMSPNQLSALRTIQGRPNVVIHNVLKQQGLKMSPNELRRCLSKATKAGIMKKTKRGYRLEIRICDNLIKSTFQELLDKKDLRLSDTCNANRYACGPGLICHKHDLNEVGPLRRGASLLSVLGGRLVRNFSFLRLGQKTCDFPDLNPESDQSKMENLSSKRPGENDDDEDDNQPPPKKPCGAREEQHVNNVLEDCWKGMTIFFQNLERTDALKMDEAPTKSSEEIDAKP